MRTPQGPDCWVACSWIHITRASFCQFAAALQQNYRQKKRSYNQPIIWQFFVENYMKIEDFGPRWRASLPPPGSVTVFVFISATNFEYISPVSSSYLSFALLVSRLIWDFVPSKILNKSSKSEQPWCKCDHSEDSVQNANQASRPWSKPREIPLWFHRERIIVLIPNKGCLVEECLKWIPRQWS